MRSFGDFAAGLPAGAQPLFTMSHDLNSTAAFLQIGYRPDSGLLIGRWLCSITDEQLRQGYGSMRRAAQEEQCRHWLVDARRRTDPADTVRGQFFLLLDEGAPVVLGEVVYAVAFLTQAHEYVRTAYLKEDAEKLLDCLGGEATAD